MYLPAAGFRATRQTIPPMVKNGHCQVLANLHRTYSIRHAEHRCHPRVGNILHTRYGVLVPIEHKVGHVLHVEVEIRVSGNDAQVQRHGRHEGARVDDNAHVSGQEWNREGQDALVQNLPAAAVRRGVLAYWVQYLEFSRFTVED